MVELGRVVRYREEDLQELAVGHLGRVEGHLDRFRMAGRLGADLAVGRDCRRCRRHSRQWRFPRPRRAGRRPGCPRSSRRRRSPSRCPAVAGSSTAGGGMTTTGPIFLGIGVSACDEHAERDKREGTGGNQRRGLSVSGEE